jgi:cyanophycin synthetase
MDIQAAARFIGPNIFSPNPLIHFRISGTGRLRSPDIDTVSRDVLLLLLPDLGSISTSCHAAEFFVSTDPMHRFPINHAIEHVAVELQNQAGAELVCARSEATRPVGSKYALVPYEEAEVCEASVQLACELIEHLAASESSPDDSFAVEFEPRIKSFLAMARRRMLPIQDRVFVRAALARDVPVRRIAGRTLQLGQGCHQSRVSATKTTRTNVVSNDIAANKDFSRRITEGLGLPTPRYERVYRNQEAVQAAERIGYPVVVKPNQGNMGQAVSVGMRDAREVSAAYKRAREVGRSVLVEELVEGDDFRVLVINGQFCAASKRTPGHVVGDGVSTIDELLKELNADPRRGTGPRSPWTRLEFDDQAERLLADRDMTRASIPLEGDTVYLRRNANTSDGGTAMDVTDEVHPDNRDIAVRAARGIGLDIAGVDFLIKDIGRSMWRGGGAICEINSRPGLRKHMWPANGPARDIMTPIVDMLYPEGHPSRIPIVGILGIDKYTARSTARLLAYLLESSGRRVGLAVGHRVHIEGRKSRTGRLKAPAAAQMILLDPDVDVAILEFTVNDIVQDGLGCDALDVSLIVPKLTDPANAGSDRQPGAPRIDELPTKARDAIRVVAQATRSALYSEDYEALRAALRAEESSEVELVAVKIDEAAPKATADEAEKSVRVPEDNQRVNVLARQIALRLGVSRKVLRRALRDYDPRTGTNKKPRKKKRRA